MINEIKKTINQGLDQLSEDQKSNGSFPSLSSKNPDNFENARNYHTPFPTALILTSLALLKDFPQTSDICEKAAEFLESQKSDYWAFNYWNRDSNESMQMPYPDDLDVTSCALAALTLHKPYLLSGSSMAKIAMVLTSVEKNEGGPYRTWLAAPESEQAWQDIDPVVNSNIAYFLSLHDVNLENIESYIESQIEQNKYHSPYYPSAYSVIYFISRFYKGEKKNKIIDFLLSQKNEPAHWGNPLDTSLAISSLINLGWSHANLAPSIQYLLNTLKRQPWPTLAFSIDPAIDGKKHFAGSRALTAGFIIEALGKYLDKTGKSKYNAQKIPKDKEEERIYQSIIGKTNQKFSEFNEEIIGQANDMVNFIIKNDHDRQIVLMPYFFAKTLKKEIDQPDKKTIIKLGQASLLGWTAYTIYDNFLDNEGDIKHLPLANICLRELSLMFNSILPDNPLFQNLWRQTLNHLENANAWEVNNCRVAIGQQIMPIPQNLPDYQDNRKLAERSLGHAIGPLAILFQAAPNNNSDDIKHLYNFFTHYLIARQLSDDAHDWEKDLLAGQINSAGAEILKKFQERYKQDAINIKEDFSKLQKIFWYEVAVKNSQEIIRHTEAALGSFKKISASNITDTIADLLKKLKKSAQKTLYERANAIEFLNEYKTTK